ncbi:hypothetical protein KGQ20_18970 [Catenulispora sp. NF23]|uniref:hypothetical protein n=1 Tax=Catenulispora pinistramenti TaxID=2705254 RepID=UPI001BAA6F63|nr:hypothetical protein [Catenulispora pinistramenti]MBS2534856.1 hypothetical protein [Catenulispora pinistramenti]
MPVTVLRRALTSVVAAALVLLAAVWPATARAAQAPPPVKYYVVTSSYQGQPEFLFEIAQRFLHNGNRSTDIFDLNKGHLEPDGATVADPTKISPGWFLQLPNDAVGDGVITGVLPTLHFDPSGTPVKYYWVADGYQGKPEFLAEIAQRFLGNQNRAQDIFAINKNRQEPDGRLFTDPAKITPGWFVKLPDDAKGDGLIAGPLPFLGPAPPGQPAPSQGSGAAPNTAGSASTGASASHSAPVSASAPASSKSKSSSSSPLVLILAIVVAVLVIAGLVWWALRAGLFAKMGAKTRGRRSRKPGPVAPRDDAAAWTIDRVLRTLATACVQAGRPLPGVAAVVVGTDTLTLRLARPDEQPPDGWSAEHQGRSWAAPLRLLQSAPVDDALPAPYPRLVSTGDSDQGRVLLNLAEAHGVISLEGDARLTRTLVADWVRELSGSPWARGTVVLRIGFGSGAGAGSGSGSGGGFGSGEMPGVEDAPNIEAAAAILDEADGGVLVLARAPGGREPERISTLAGTADGRWSVVVLGSLKNASWRLVADAAGTLDTGLLGEPVRLHGKRPLEHA